MVSLRLPLSRWPPEVQGPKRAGPKWGGPAGSPQSRPPHRSDLDVVAHGGGGSAVAVVDQPVAAGREHLPPCMAGVLVAHELRRVPRRDGAQRPEAHRGALGQNERIERLTVVVDAEQVNVDCCDCGRLVAVTRAVQSQV